MISPLSEFSGQRQRVRAAQYDFNSRENSSACRSDKGRIGCITCSRIAAMFTGVLLPAHSVAHRASHRSDPFLCCAPELRLRPEISSEPGDLKRCFDRPGSLIKIRRSWSRRRNLGSLNISLGQNESLAFLGGESMLLCTQTSNRPADKNLLAFYKCFGFFTW
jgi:hypothetical protein